MAKEMINFNLPKESSSIIKVIGVGGGGSNAVNHMYKQGIRGVDFVVCNTDQQALDMSPVPKKIALGSSLTEGRGAGAQAEVGRNAAIENLDDIKEVLTNQTKMVFITAGMGGGTGTGAAPVIAEAARELGILTVGIVTIPFGFEGKKRKLQATLGLEELKKHVDTVLIISNDKLRDMYGNLKLSEAFGQADDVLSIAAKGIAEIITVEGYVNVDFEDVRTVMTNSGVAIMGSATTSGEDRAIKAVEQALASPLLNDNNIFGASNILLYISSGREEVTMDEVAEITDYIQEEAGMDADVIWGNGTDEEMDDKLTLTVIATGFTGEKLEKVTGSENVIRHVLTSQKPAAPTARPATPSATATPKPTEEKTSIPEGLTSEPVLKNPHLKSMVDGEKPAPQLISKPKENTPAENTSNSSHIVRYTLDDEKTEEEEKPSIMAYKLDETDPEVNAFLDEEAPEMKGIKEGEPFPLYNEEEEEDVPTTASSTPSYSTPDVSTAADASTEEQEATQSMPTFNLFSKPLEDQPSAKETPTTQTESEHTPAEPTEKPTEIEFEIRKEEPPKKEGVKMFNLYDEDDAHTPPTSEKAEETTNQLSEEPKLITRSAPLDQKVNSALDSEEMIQRQQERMMRLKTVSKRFNTPNSLAELENVPAYKRRNVSLDEQPHSSESAISRFDVGDTNEEDENGNKRGGLSDGNEFLHQSVD